MEEQQAPECYQGAVVEFKSQMTVVTAMWTIYDQKIFQIWFLFFHVLAFQIEGREK